MADSTTSAAAAVHHRDSPAAPPPTPSNHQAPLPFTTDPALSTLLHQVLLLSTSTPTLSSPPLLRRRRSPLSLNPRSDESHKTFPTISLKDSEQYFSSELLSAAENQGFFHLADHSIPSQLHCDALLEAQSLMISSKQASSKANSTLGFAEEDDNNNSKTNEGFVVLDASNNELINEFPALQDFVQRLMKTGMEVAEKLMAVAGYAEKTSGEKGLNLRGLLWISKSNEEEDGDGEEPRKLRSYPYVLSLRYEVGRSWLMIGDSGEWLSVAGGEGSILVAVGDVLQVWSNGKFKKVRGIPESKSRGRCKNPGNISISLLITLPVDSMIHPLPVAQEADGNEDDEDHKFSAFSFNEYARIIYHESLIFEDPLLRYQVADSRSDATSYKQ